MSEEALDQPNSQRDDKVTIARITAIQAVIVALLALIGTSITGITGYYVAKQKFSSVPPPTVVPPNPNVKSVPKLDEESGEGFQTLRDVSIFDLRGWKQISPSETNLRVSPANYINYLHVKKTKEAKIYRAHYATTGSLIDLRCITHEAQVLKQASPVEHAGQNVNEYQVDVNIENVEINKEFLIVIEGTYWNSFQNLTEESVSTYTDEDIQQLNELSIFVLLPQNKPFKSLKLWDQVTGSSERNEYRGRQSQYADKNGYFIYWSILDRKPGHHYEVTWTW